MLIFQGVYLAIRPDTAGHTGVRYTLEYPRGTDDMCSQFLHQLHGVGTEIHPFLWTMSIEKTWTNNVAWLCSKPKVEPETKSQSHCVSWVRISRHPQFIHISSNIFKVHIFRAEFRVFAAFAFGAGVFCRKQCQELVGLLDQICLEQI